MNNVMQLGNFVQFLFSSLICNFTLVGGVSWAEEIIFLVNHEQQSDPERKQTNLRHFYNLPIELATMLWISNKHLPFTNKSL